METRSAVDIRVAHTADLAPDVLNEARALMDVVFPDDFADDDWEHSLGGLHLLVSDDSGIIGHAAVVQRRVIAGGRTMRAGYVEAVAVRPDRQRERIGTALMAKVDDIVRAAYDVGLLGSSEEGWRLYERTGWIPWRGPLLGMTPSGIVSCAEEQGWVLALPVSATLDLDAELVCDWREGDLW